MRLGERCRLAAVHRVRALDAAVSLGRLRGLRPAGGPEPATTHREALPMSVATWTTERIEQLRHCVVTGLTCSQIAAEIGVTRNAVIGKIHRLGLSPGRPAGAAARPSPPRVVRPRISTQRKLLRLICADAPSVGVETAALDWAAVDSA